MQCGSCFVFLLSVVVIGMTSHLMANAWRFEHRSFCAHTNQECSNEGGCCSSDDVCVTLHDEVLEGSMSVAPRRCKTIYRYPQAVSRNGQCDDSRQCYDRCCQVYRGFRYGTLYRCGTQIEGRMAHDCVVRHF